MSGDDMIVYEFIFIDEEGYKCVKDIWAYYETEAWYKAESYAGLNGYVDFYVKEN